jgi:hypothetical protein
LPKIELAGLLKLALDTNHQAGGLLPKSPV